MKNHPSKHPVNQAVKDEDGDLTPFAYHMLAIGRLCVTWAFLDRQLSDILSLALNVSLAKAACVATEARDTSEKCRLLKTLTYLEAPSKEWRAIFEGLLDQISNQMAPKRNRYVHDYWTSTPDAVERVSRMVTLGKPQSFKDKQVTFDTRHVTPYGQVDEFSTEIVTVVTGLLSATYDLQEWRKGQLPKQPRLCLWAKAMKLEAQPRPKTKGDQKPRKSSPRKSGNRKG